MIELNINLPNKPSELLELALYDLAMIEQDDAYHVDMRYYHRRVVGSPCEVCLAGSIIARHTTSFEPTYVGGGEEYILPRGFDAVTEDKLKAINQFAYGDISSGLELLCVRVEIINIQSKVDVPNYVEDSRGWWGAMRGIASRLKAVGL